MTKKKICSKKAKNKMQLYHSGSMKKSCLSFALSISFESFVFEMRYLESKGFDRYSTVLATVQWKGTVYFLILERKIFPNHDERSDKYERSKSY